MTVSELKVKLFELDVPHYCYSIGSCEDGRVCLTEEAGKWLVFFCEGGEKLELTEHNSESEACEDMIGRLTE